MLNGRVALVDRLSQLIPQNCPPQPSHIAAAKSFRFIVTTNWDLLFEAAYRSINQHYQHYQHYQVLSQDSDAPLFNFDQHNLLKIHGSADRPATLVASTDDCENYTHTHARLLAKVADCMQNNTVLFVGYGLRDEHVRHLLSGIRRSNARWARSGHARPRPWASATTCAPSCWTAAASR